MSDHVRIVASDSRYNSYKYKVELRLYLNSSDSEGEDVSEYIRDLVIYNRFNEHVFPVFKLDLVLPPAIVRQMQVKPKEVYFIITIIQYTVSKKVETVGATKSDGAKKFILKNTRIKPMDINRTPVPQNVTRDKNDVHDNSKTIRLMLSCLIEGDLDVNRVLHSNVFKDAQLKDVILFYINKLGISNVLMSPPDNDKVYRQVIIPPLNFTNILGYLQKVYGIYETGLRLFMGIDYNYILNNDPINDIQIPRPPMPPNSWQRVLITLVDSANMAPDAEGYFPDYENTIHKIKLVDNTTILNQNVASKEIMGDHLKFMSRRPDNRNIQRYYDMDMKIPKLEPTYEPGDREYLIWNNYDNPFIESSYRQELYHNILRINIPWQDIDPTVFMYTRIYLLNFLQGHPKEYLNGPMQLESVIFHFNKGQSEDNYRIMGSANFIIKYGEGFII